MAPLFDVVADVPKKLIRGRRIARGAKQFRGWLDFMKARAQGNRRRSGTRTIRRGSRMFSIAAITSGKGFRERFPACRFGFSSEALGVWTTNRS